MNHKEERDTDQETVVVMSPSLRSSRSRRTGRPFCRSPKHPQPRCKHCSFEPRPHKPLQRPLRHPVPWEILPLSTWPPTSPFREPCTKIPSRPFLGRETTFPTAQVALCPNLSRKEQQQAINPSLSLPSPAHQRSARFGPFSTGALMPLTHLAIHQCGTVRLRTLGVNDVEQSREGATRVRSLSTYSSIVPTTITTPLSITTEFGNVSEMPQTPRTPRCLPTPLTCPYTWVWVEVRVHSQFPVRLGLAVSLPPRPPNAI